MEETQVIESQVSEVSQPEVTTTEPTQEQIDKWETDKRYESSWKKDPNNLYKSYRSLEKQYSPFQQTLKEQGIKDINELKTTLGEYKTYKDPNSEINQFLNYLNPILNDQTRMAEFQKYLQDQHSKIEREKFGQNLSPEQIQAIKQGQEAAERLKQYEQQMEVQKIEKEISTNLDNLEQMAHKNNWEFNKNEFLNYCREKNVPTSLMEDVFMAKAKPLAEKMAARQAEERLMTNSKVNQAAVSLSGTKAAPGGRVTFDKALDSILGLNN